MLNDLSRKTRVYLACGYTDMRLGIDGLIETIQETFHLDPRNRALFLFCGHRQDRIKGLIWEGDGFVLVYKRLANGRFQWPKDTSELRQLTAREYRMLIDGLSIVQHKTIHCVDNCTPIR